MKSWSIPKVKILYRDTYVYRDTVFIGCTLWSNVDPEVFKNLNDHKYIPNWSWETQMSEHYKDTEYLRSLLPLSCVVLTHYAPSLLAYIPYPNKSEDLYSGYYNTDCDDIIPFIKAWIFGHTHIKISTGKFYNNPVGYPDELYAADSLHLCIQFLLIQE